MNIEARLLCEKLSPLLNFVSGSEDQQVQRISSPNQADKGSIVFAGTSKILKQALDSKADVLVVGEKDVQKVGDFPGTVLSSPHVPLAMSQVGKNFFPVTANRQPFDGERIHPTAVISRTAKIADTAIIHPNVTIGANTVIGENCFIGASTAIEANCQIGEGTHLHAHVSISHGTILGKNCEVHPQTSLGTEGFGYAQDQHFNHYRITHYGKLVIGDNVHIGAGVTMDRGTFEDSTIGSGTIIDNLNHFGHNFTCGERTIFVGGTIVAGSVTIGSRCMFGGRTTIGGHLSICDDVHVAGVSGITKDITKPGRYGGYPLQEYRANLKTLSSLASVPEMRKTLADLVKSSENK